jgi:hypothetical protein
MQLQDQLHEIPRTAVRVWLRAARLPLQAVEAMTRRGDHDAEWPPTLAFESFEAQVKQVAGAVLRDDDLLEEGRLTQAKVGQLRRAAELETVAQRREATAAAKHEAEKEAADQRRRRVERVANEREQSLAREREAEKRKVERDAQRKEAQAARTAAATDKEVQRQERAAARTRLDVERAALRKERTAVAAKRRAVSTDQKIRTTKAARKRAR